MLCYLWNARVCSQATTVCVQCACPIVSCGTFPLPVFVEERLVASGYNVGECERTKLLGAGPCVIYCMVVVFWRSLLPYHPASAG